MSLKVYYTTIKFNIMSKLQKIEKRITELKIEISNKPEEIHAKNIKSGGIITQGQFERMVESENKKLKDELDILEKERQFIVDRKDPLWVKIIWNIIVPIIVTVITFLITNHYFK